MTTQHRMVYEMQTTTESIFNTYMEKIILLSLP